MKIGPRYVAAEEKKSRVQTRCDYGQNHHRQD